ncbi:serine protease [Longimycelium tulufanense]|uniref:Serine protease n=1 Tax=Longimycelium tulufanense TaxID=907463 RepID=A0A8J3C6L5_9PSEU|nr:S1 family peptidase [Longimycelium tulufanense]GGM41817.1 serine protease [Longimycelium tulufanense]
MAAGSTPRGRSIGSIAGAGVVATISSAVLALVGLPAAAAPATPALTGAQLAAVDYLSGQGLDRTTAVRRVLAEDAQTHQAGQLAARLGDRMAGAYLDGSGTLVVNVTDSGAADEVRRAGAIARTVANGITELNSAKAQLDRAGRGVPGASWFIDPGSDQVVLQVPEREGVTDLLSTAQQLAGKVRVERSTGMLSTMATSFVGGQQIEFTKSGTDYVCSAGFNATDSSGRSVMVTAGHCGQGVSEFRRNGTYLGAVQAASFPGHDYAYSTVDTGTWVPRGAVDRYNGTSVTVAGYSSAPVGSTVCKSGRTTGWTCGQIQAYDATVNYEGGSSVSGLVKASVCTEGGDSGGAWMAGNYAQGVTSGGSYFVVDGQKVCGEKAGKPNTAYYQPIGAALSAYGLTLTTS